VDAEFSLFSFDGDFVAILMVHGVHKALPSTDGGLLEPPQPPVPARTPQTRGRRPSEIPRPPSRRRPLLLSRRRSPWPRSLFPSRARGSYGPTRKASVRAASRCLSMEAAGSM
jgi:hypothetical protein